MKLEIKLKDPKYCDGCPCMGMVGGCKMGFLSTKIGERTFKGLNYEYDGETGKYKRPERCTKECGE